MKTITETKKIKKTYRDLKSGLFMAIWPIIGYLIFHIFPMILSVYLSFTELKSYFIEDAVLIGFKNFSYILNDSLFWLSLYNTAYYLIGTIVSILLGLGIAMLLTQKIIAKRFFRSVFFIPFICSVVAASIMWKWFFETDYGILNSLLSVLNIDRVPWLNNSRYFRPALLIMNIWGGTGFNIILYQSALGNVDRNYYEAADIDGANAVQKFFKVTIPMISPTSFYLLVMGIIGGLQAFTMQQVMGGDSGGPGKAGLTVVFYLYNMAFTNVTSYGMGIASAVAWILAILIAVITVINFKVSKKWVHYE